MFILRITVLLMSVGLLSDCSAFDVKHDYAKTTAALSYSGQGKLGVAVQDRRAYVVSGEKRENYVGFFRGEFGNHMSNTTKSGAPLASDMANSLAGTMKHAGYDVVKLEIPPSDGAEDVRKVLAGGADKALFLVLDEWKAETNPSYLGSNNPAAAFTNTGTGGATTLHHNATLSVMKRGKVLASKKIQGDEGLGSSLLGPEKYAKKAVPPWFKGKLEEMLNDPAIARALK